MVSLVFPSRNFRKICQNVPPDLILLMGLDDTLKTLLLQPNNIYSAFSWKETSILKKRGCISNIKGLLHNKIHCLHIYLFKKYN